MRIARVKGTVILGKQLAELRSGSFLLCETLDSQALHGVNQNAPRRQPMPESLVVFDDRGASPGQMIAVSEGREATMPWHPQRVPIDAYCAAILDQVEVV